MTKDKVFKKGQIEKQYNKSTWFIYPCMEIPRHFNSNLYSTYLYNKSFLKNKNDELLYALFKFHNDDIEINAELSSVKNYLNNRKDIYFNSYDFVINDYYYLCCILMIPNKYRDDYHKFIKGQYSKFNSKLKLLITNNGDSKYKKLLDILNKSKEYKKELESILGTELNEDSELFSIINEEEETLDRDKL